MKSNQIQCNCSEINNWKIRTINQILEKKIGVGLSCNIKRGCSEFYSSHPEYQEINNFGPQKMNYIEEWSETEKNHDKNKTFLGEKIRRQSISGLNLNDFLTV